MINGDKPDPTLSEKKQLLLEKNKNIQIDLQAEMEQLKSNAMHYGKYVLIVGGTFVVTYYMIKTFFSDDEDETDEKKKIIRSPSEGDSHKITTYGEKEDYPVVVKMIMSSIATFLLSIAKEKLIKFLEEKYINEGQTNTKPTA